MRKRTNRKQVIELEAGTTFEQALNEKIPLGAYTPAVESEPTRSAYVEQLASEEVDRLARYRRWDAIEAHARRTGFKGLPPRPVASRPVEIPLAPSAADRARMEDEEFLQTEREEIRHALGVDETGVWAEPKAKKAKPKRRSELVMRLEAAQRGKPPTAAARA